MTLSDDLLNCIALKNVSNNQVILFTGTLSATEYMKKNKGWVLK